MVQPNSRLWWYYMAYCLFNARGRLAILGRCSANSDSSYSIYYTSHYVDGSILYRKSCGRDNRCIKKDGKADNFCF